MTHSASVNLPLQRRRTPLPVRSACAILAMALPGAVQADDDPNPYFVGVSESITHDSNVFRVPSHVQGDNYTSTGLRGGIDQPFGGQHFYAAANVNKNKFHSVSELDNTSYGLDTRLDWVTVGAFSGILRLNQNQSLATYGTTNQIALAERNIQRLRQLNAKVVWGLPDAALGLQSSYTRQSVRYSAPRYAQYETDQTMADVGIVARPGGALTLGAALRRTQGEYPARFLDDGSADSYRRNDVDLTVAWVATGASTLNGRVSLGRNAYTNASAQRGSDTTGSLQWLYTPVGKLSFDTLILRDTGQNTTFQTLSLNGANATLSSDNSQLTTTLALNTAYAMTGKVSLTMAARLSRRSLLNTNVASTGVSNAPALGNDRIATLKIGVAYLATNSLSFNCDVGRDQRSVSGDTPAYLSYPYAARTASCTGQFNLH